MSRVRANTIMDQTGSGGPDFPFGFTASTGTVTGILTAATYDIAELNVRAAATVASTTASKSRCSCTLAPTVASVSGNDWLSRQATPARIRNPTNNSPIRLIIEIIR